MHSCQTSELPLLSNVQNFWNMIRYFPLLIKVQCNSNQMAYCFWQGIHQNDQRQNSVQYYISINLYDILGHWHHFLAKILDSRGIEIAGSDISQPLHSGIIYPF